MNLAERVYYDPSSPTFLRWKVGGSGYVKDSVAGSIVTKENGYRVVLIQINRRRFMGHRVIWALHHGRIDDDLEIDHRDGNPLNNRIKNLRLVPKLINARNRKMSRNNRTGATGVQLTYSRSGTVIWRAAWSDASGKVRTKSFSESVYGEFAELMAIDKRLLEISKLPHYTERHGV